MTQTTPAYNALVAHHRRLHHLGHLQAIATWDRMTHMPPAAASARAAAQAEMAALLQQLRTDAKLDAQLASASLEALGADEALNLALMQREQRLAHAVPDDVAARREACESAAMRAWGPAKAANDWPGFAEQLKPLVAVVREEAACLGQALGLSRYDALLERWEPGMRHARVKALFADVASWLPGLVAQAQERQARSAIVEPIVEPIGPFPAAAQQRLCEQVMATLGFDFKGGRLDTTLHPFTGGVPEDVRLATRFAEDSFMPALMGTIHETGHARYQQDLPDRKSVV